ncbi:MAG: AAA domain-containing protein, partial [Algoriphagus sp.]|nr:AAA domain-containing protein [Algoriphagus sp.]
MPESIFQTYLNRLTDLSSKNRSLYLPRTESLGMSDLREFDFLNGEPAFEILRKAIQGKKRIHLIPESDPRRADINALSKNLSRIAFRDQLTQEETGDQSLFLAWPFIEGKLINGQILRAPLLMLPISLVKEKGDWNMIPTDSWTWNPAFLLAYRHAFGNELDIEKLDEGLQNLSEDPTEFRTQLSKILQENFSIQLSSSLFEDQISPFPNSQISLDSDRFQDGKISLKTYALIGQFAQKGSFLFREYEELMEKMGDLSLEDLFHQFFASGEKLPIPREDQLFPVFPLDASQENVLVQVRQGKSLVVEGPPGTGKSQLIANLVSDYVARGKKVLVVSQKRAALDVVFERMEKAGFGDFLGLVHDFRADHKLLFEKIRKQIESIENYQEQNRGIDSIQLEREISQLSKTISRLSENFELFRQELFNEKPVGIPVKSMYLKADLGKSSLDTPSELLKFDYNQVLEFEKEYRIYQSFQGKFKNSFWENRTTFTQIEPANFSRILQSLKEIEAFKNSISTEFELKYLLEIFRTILDSKPVSPKISHLQNSLNYFVNKDSSILLAFQPREIKKLNSIQKWIEKAIQEFQSLNLKLSDHPDELGQLESELQILLPKSQSFFGKIQANWTKSKFPLTFEALSNNGLKFNYQSLTLIDLENRTRLRLHQEFQNLPISPAFSLKSFSPENLINELGKINPILNWAENWEENQEIHGLLNWSGLDSTLFQPWLQEIAKLVKEFETISLGWKTWLISDQILDILGKGLKKLDLGNELSLNQTFSELSAYDFFLGKWGKVKRELGKKLESDFVDLNTDAQLSAFRNGWYLAWIAQIERIHPVLAEAGGLKMKNDLTELKTALLEKRKISRFMTQLRLREQVSSNLEFNRLGNRLTYRELLHQVSKKRQRWSVRKLVEEMGSEVFRLLPCWLASPETVSALFPIAQSFDLVIFDEASQCQVERGLPAMLRGKQVVIAGDSKQLRPSDFYQVKWESEEEGMEYEAESLLELVGHFFEKHQLKGHYRSADPGLIHFSNSNFYDNQLETLPDYETSKVGKPAFTWEKVEGIWENQVNKTEADAVVEKVKIILKDSPNGSIGIVTGNYFQMELIREKLWKEGIQQESIKVRNIENVQGDEFDEVILSLGYAPNREGKLVTNFGLLGKSGAENRLNVAITRSRKRMHVISSIEPEDFRPGQLQNTGLILLREFLSFVK